MLELNRLKENLELKESEFTIEIKDIGGSYLEISWIKKEKEIFCAFLYANNDSFDVQECTIKDPKFKIVEFKNDFTLLIHHIEKIAKKLNVKSITYLHDLDVFILNNYGIAKKIAKETMIENQYKLDITIKKYIKKI
jgi:hypothetical protein